MLFLLETIQRESSISFPFLGSWSVNPPAFFSLFGRSIYLYGVMIALGFMLAILYCGHRAPEFGISADSFYDLVIWLIPLSILGARLYFVIFQADYYFAHPGEILAVWEGGLAIYGGIIAGLLIMFLFCRRRNIPFLLLCDIIVPGLALAQSIGRWGNWFNMEAYGLPVNSSFPCFFPLAVQIPAEGYAWHLATFFYESIWDFSIFVFLLLTRHTLLQRKKGDIFFFYLFLYASGRLIIEELRMDSLYASSVRISQLFSALLCTFILFHYRLSSANNVRRHPFLSFVLFPLSVVSSIVIIFYSLFGHSLFSLSAKHAVLLLSACSILMIIGLCSVYFPRRGQEVKNADYCV